MTAAVIATVVARLRLTRGMVLTAARLVLPSGVVGTLPVTILAGMVGALPVAILAGVVGILGNEQGLAERLRRRGLGRPHGQAGNGKDRSGEKILLHVVSSSHHRG